jgi:hypothetical protein
MADQCETLMLLIILIWGESVKIDGKSVISIRHNESVNVIFYHQNSSFIDDSCSYVDLAQKSIFLELSYFQLYVHRIQLLAFRGNLYDLQLEFYSIKYHYSICSDSRIISESEDTLYFLFSFLFVNQRKFINHANDETIISILESNEFCMIYELLDLITFGFSKLAGKEMSFLSSEANDQTKLIIILILSIFLEYLFLIFLPFFIFSRKYINELELFRSILNSIDSQAKLQPILSNCEQSNLESDIYYFPSHKGFLSKFIYSILLLYFLSIGTHVLSLILANDSNEQILTILNFLFKNSERTKIIPNILVHLLIGITLNMTEIHWNFLCQTDELSKNLKAIDYLITLAELLNSGTEQSSSIFGFDDIIDNLLENHENTPKELFEDLHDYYSLLGCNQLQYLFRNLVIEAINLKDQFNGIIHHDIFDHLYHIGIQHLIPKLYSIDDRLLEILTETISHFQSYLLICLFVSIGLCILCNIIVLFFCHI